MKKESLKFIDLMSIGTVIWDLLGINLYFWGLSFRPISLYNVMGEWAIWWIFVRFNYCTIKKVRE